MKDQAMNEVMGRPATAIRREKSTDWVLLFRMTG